MERKIITRRYYETMSDKEIKVGRFICTGQWADGHLAYSRLDENNERIEEDDGRFVQVRGSNGLVMLGI